MGHSSIQITVDTYGHLIPGADIAWGDRLDSKTTRHQSTPGRTKCKTKQKRKAWKCWKILGCPHGFEPRYADPEPLGCTADAAGFGSTQIEERRSNETNTNLLPAGSRIQVTPVWAEKSVCSLEPRRCSQVAPSCTTLRFTSIMRSQGHSRPRSMRNAMFPQRPQPSLSQNTLQSTPTLLIVRSPR